MSMLLTSRACVLLLMAAATVAQAQPVTPIGPLQVPLPAPVVAPVPAPTPTMALPVPEGCEATPPAALTWQAAQARLLACNRELVAAQRAIEGVAADRITAGQRPNPNLSAGIGSINPQLGVGSGPVWQKAVDSSVRYEQLIERGGKRSLRLRGAEAQFGAALQDRREVARSQRLLLADAMTELAALDARIAVLVEVTDLYAQAGRANARRVSRGDMAPIDAQRQAIETARAAADLQQARVDAQRSRLVLAALLAWESQAAALNVDPSVLEPPSVDVALDTVERRPDLVAARLRVDAARAARELAIAQATRDVTVGVQVNHFPSTPQNSSGNGNSVSVSMGVPLFVNHRFEGEIARATSDLRTAEGARQRLLASAYADVVRINADVSAARSRLELLQTQQVALAEQVAQAAERGYTRGALTVLELLDARRVLRQTRLDVLTARAELARATLARNVALRASGYGDSDVAP